MTKQETQNKRVTALVAILAILILAVVTFYSSAKELTEKEKFILANTEITCEVLKDPSLTVNLEKSKNISKEIFKKYKFPIEDNEAMLLLLDRYETDAEVLESVQAKLEEECIIE